jgi:hypothetical protein
VARPDHKASFETIKGHLGVDKNRLKEAIRTLMDSSHGPRLFSRGNGGPFRALIAPEKGAFFERFIDIAVLPGQ